MITQDELRGLVELKREGPTLDYKQDLNLEKDKDKAEFIKDVLALANSGRTAYIVTGIRNRTWEPLSISQSYSQAQLNQILQDRTDPPVRVEYAEIELNGLTHGIVKIFGEDPPYLVMVKDKFGSIQKGTVFIRNVDMNEGARRADLNLMYATPADLRLDYEVTQKELEDSKEVEIKICLINRGKREAEHPYLRMQFLDIERLVSCTGGVVNLSSYNKGVPIIRVSVDNPIYPTIRWECGKATVIVKKDIKQIPTSVKLWAGNMHKEGMYTINL